jgi:hypothetical protein
MSSPNSLEEKKLELTFTKNQLWRHTALKTHLVLSLDILHLTTAMILSLDKSLERQMFLTLDKPHLTIEMFLSLDRPHLTTQMYLNLNVGYLKYFRLWITSWQINKNI